MYSTESTKLSPTTLVVVQPTLRPYQQRFVADIYAHIRAGRKRILGFAPTGSGKTVVACQIGSDAVSRSKRVLFIVHRDILIAQTFNKMRQFGLVECGFIKSGWQENRDALVQIASVQTLEKRDWWHQYPADVIIIDEAHIVAYASVVKRMMAQVYPQAIYLGLSATPWRLSKREGMGDIFESLVIAPMPHELIDQGFLVKPSYFSLSQADLERVGTVAGDFDEGSLAIACDRPELISQIVEDWKRLAYGRRTIAFAVNVQHSQHLCSAFAAEGIPAAHVDGTTPHQAANRIYQQLATGEILVLSSCMKLTEGFDESSVSAVLLCRPTQSKALFFQMVGRGLRLSPETEKIDCVVLDPSGNIGRHGFVEDLKQISLELGQNSKDVSAPLKVCPDSEGGCGAILYTFFMRCPKCGYVFEERQKVYIVPGLQQLLSSEDWERYEFYREKICTAYSQGYAPGWAAMLHKERYGHWPPDAWARSAVFGDNPSESQKEAYHSYLQALAQRKEKPPSWIQRCMNLEFGLLEKGLGRG